LNFTPATLEKLVPVIVTFVPETPKTGVKDAIVGDWMNTKDVNDVAVPPVVVTETLPVVVVGTMADIEVELRTA